jgi:hypothetical protein
MRCLRHVAMRRLFATASLCSGRAPRPTRPLLGTGNRMSALESTPHVHPHDSLRAAVVDEPASPVDGNLRVAVLWQVSAVAALQLAALGGHRNAKTWPVIPPRPQSRLCVRGSKAGADVQRDEPRRSRGFSRFRRRRSDGCSTTSTRPIFRRLFARRFTRAFVLATFLIGSARVSTVRGRATRLAVGTSAKAPRAHCLGPHRARLTSPAYGNPDPAPISWTV